MLTKCLAMGSGFQSGLKKTHKELCWRGDVTGLFELQIHEFEGLSDEKKKLHRSLGL